MLGPLGTAQLLSTPSASRRKSQCSCRAWCSWTTKIGRGLSWLAWHITPPPPSEAQAPRAHLRELPGAGQVELERGDGDVALAQGGFVGVGQRLGAAEVGRGPEVDP